MPEPRLSHLTLNTGHLAHTPRDDVAPGGPGAAPAGGEVRGPVPGMDGWHIAMLPALHADAMRPAGTFSGAGYFQIADEPGLSKRPLAGCVACWRAEASHEAWRMARLAYRALRVPLVRLKFWRAPADDPPPLPWLAVYLTPALTTADAADVHAFGDLERCVAWTMIGGNP